MKKYGIITTNNLKGVFIMKKSALVPVQRLVNCMDGETIGFIYSKGTYTVPLSLDFIKKNKLDSWDFIEYVDVPEIQVLVWGDKYVLSEKVLLTLSEYEDDAFVRLEDGRVAIWGRVIEPRCLVVLDNELAYQRAERDGD